MINNPSFELSSAKDADENRVPEYEEEKPKTRVIKLGRASGLAEGASRTVEIAEGQKIVLCKLEGQIYALSSACPHLGGPLEKGEIDGEVLVCPWHGRRFCIKTGECENHSELRALKLTVNVEEDEILLSSAALLKAVEKKASDSQSDGS